MNRKNWWAAAGAVAWLGCASAPEAGEMMKTTESTLNRGVPPEVGPAPALELPPIQRHRLSNGLEVLVVEQHDLPVVDLQLVIRTGAGADAPAEAGRASMTAELLDEGTATRSALELAEAVDFLGADLETGASWDASSIALHVLRPRLGPALELMADVALRPAFPEPEVKRIRDERLALFLQQQDEPRAMATKAFAAELYGPAHPYGTPVLGTRESVGGLDREALARFYRAYYRPNNAFLVAVGDIEASTLLPILERTFGSWEEAPVQPVRLPAPPASRPTAVYLVDKPGAAQSEIRVGHLGPARSTADYFPLVVLNTILGGSFTSRLNITLREEKGFTYGAGSRFDFRKGPGPFLASSAVFTGVTDSALVIFVDQIRRIREEPVPPEELERAKSYLALGLPRELQTTGDIAGHVTEIELYALGDDYLARYTDRVRAVTAVDVARVAREYLHPDRMALVVVGDRAQVEDPIRRLSLAPVEVKPVM